MKQKTIYQLCIQAYRYSRDRDNHLAPYGAVLNIKEVLVDMEKEYRLHTINQLLREITWDLRGYDRKYKRVWIDFSIELAYMSMELE